MAQRQPGRGLWVLGMVVLLLFGAAASASAAAPEGGSDDSSLTLMVGISAADGDLYHTDATPLTLSVAVRNDASEDISFEYNPSCPFDLSISAADGSLLYDADDARTCAGQRRAADIPAGGERYLGESSWDWMNDGVLVPSGDLLISVDSGDAVDAVDEVVEFHRLTDTPAGLSLELLLPPLPGFVMASQPGDVILARASLQNSGSEAVVVPYDDACRIVQRLSSDAVSELGCGAGETVPAGAGLDLGWLEWNLNEIVLPDGEHELAAWPTGASDASWSMIWLHDASSGDDRVADLRLEATVLSGQDPTVSGQTFEVAVDLHNDAATATTIVFEDDCLILSHVVSASGELLYDDSSLLDCQPDFSDLKLQPGESYRLSTTTIETTVPAGCGWPGGQHMAVFRVPAIDLTESVPFEVFDTESAWLCRLDAQSLHSTLLEIVEMRSIEEGSADESLSFDLRLFHQGDEPLILHWTDDCRIGITLRQLVGEQVRNSEAACDGVSGDSTTVQPGEVLLIGTVEVAFAADGFDTGTWLIDATLLAHPSLTTSAARAYDGIGAAEPAAEVDETVVEQNESIGQTAPEPVIEAIYFEGEWKHVRTSQGGCWLLHSPDGRERALVSNEVIGWSPAPQRQGTYRVLDASFVTGDACAEWSPGLHIAEVVDEWQTPATPDDGAGQQEGAAGQRSTTVIGIATPAIIIVATTSLLAMLLITAVNTEWIRLPVMNMGLALVGMVRRGRDYDGEYQRGRIIGFLVANPGAHFRALLGALDMSNGQLSHHLKVLLGEDKLWRRRDGRLVRFYPSTIATQTEQGDLPVPLLTPDPNSLQGKILNLLDQTGNEYVNLSQKELAERLSASQQLISHHLRTLQKYGLVERQKVGLRYRYELTREAVFLLTTSDDWPAQ